MDDDLLEDLLDLEQSGRGELLGTAPHGSPPYTMAAGGREVEEDYHSRNHKSFFHPHIEEDKVTAPRRAQTCKGMRR